MIELQQLLKTCVSEEASDLHLVEGSPPVLRLNGLIARIKSPPLSDKQIREMSYPILSKSQREQLEREKTLDFSFTIKKVSRFRANYFYQKGNLSCAFRRISLNIPLFSELGLPSIVANVVNFPSGLILCVGPTGSGKSTTMAALINEINKTRKSNIITIEDPIEYIFEHSQSIVSQREVGLDTFDFALAAKSLLRQDPDICLIGELRDRDSVNFALRLAETGHLVFASLHTKSAAESIHRILGVFDGSERENIRSMLSQSLNAVISQRLLPGLNGSLVVATEFLQVNSAIRNLIREDKVHQIYSIMQLNKEKLGMMTMNQSLMNLVLKRKVDIKEAFMFSPDPGELDSLLKKVGI